MTSVRMTSAVVLGADESVVLGHYADRLERWDPESVVRLVDRGGALGCYGAPPVRCLALLTVPVAEPAGVEGLDRCLSAAALAEALRVARPSDESLAGGPRSGAGQVCVTLPPPARASRTLSVLPPDDGWHLPVPGVSGDLVPLVEDAAAEFRRRAPGLDPARTAALAEEIWSRPAWGGLPMRALHAARRLGFLGQDASRVASATAGEWKRLTTVRGVVFVHSDGIPGVLRVVT